MCIRDRASPLGFLPSLDHYIRPREKFRRECQTDLFLSLIHISEPTRLLSISYAVFCLKKKSKFFFFFFFLMIRRPPRSTLDRSSAASDVYKRQHYIRPREKFRRECQTDLF